MADPRAFQTQLNSIMEIMTRAVVKQICRIVDSDFTGLRTELERARHQNAALGDKMRVLESEVEMLRGTKKTGTRKSFRSVCIQTLEAPDSPSINEIFGKDWCSSLWDGKQPRPEKKAKDVDVVESEEELESRYHSEVQRIKEEHFEQEISSARAETGNAAEADQSETPSDPSASREIPEDQVEDNDELDFMSSAFSETPDDPAMPPDSPRATTTTKFISMDGTVQDVVVESDDPLEFDQHCMPIEFMVGEPSQDAEFDGQEEGGSQNLVMGSEYVSSAGDARILNYFGRLHLPSHQARPGSSKVKYTCIECGKTFPRQNGLTLHMKSHRRKNANTCRTCKVVFPQKNLLRTHKCLPPEKPAEKPGKGFHCEICGKLLHSKATLKVHYAVHTGERPYRCSFCGRGFTQKGNLNTHERIHRGERPYICIICGRGFTQKGNLNQHLAIHNSLSNMRIRSPDKTKEVSQQNLLDSSATE